MRKSIITLSGLAVLVSCFSVPGIAGQGTGSDESEPRIRERDRARPEQERRWKQLDQDNDGRISRSEWKRDPQAFDRMDADKDGFLTREELKSAVREFPGRHHNGFKQMDVDGDRKISRSEWKGKEETFNRLDANHDGLLTRDELRQGREGHGSRVHRSDRTDKGTL